MNKAKKKANVFLISTITLLTLLCLTICGWYIYVAFFAKQKATSTTFKVGELTLADGTSENLIEIQYFANKDNSGLEAFEIKYNYFLDEKRESFYSQGLQYVANNPYSNIKFQQVHNDLTKVKTGKSGVLFLGTRYYECQNSIVLHDSAQRFNYQEVAEGNFIKSTNPIGLDSFFKIQIGETLALMKFKGLDTQKDTSTSLGKSLFKNDFPAKDDSHDMYLIYDQEYFSKLLYESVKSAELGANYEAIFEFGDLFWYYKATEEDNTVYERINEPVAVGNGEYLDPGKIKDFIKSYYSIRIKTFEYGLQKSQDSMFNSVLGNTNYNSTGKYQSDDYFVGKTVINCNIYSFDFENDGLNNLTLKLNDNFISAHEKYKKSIVLSIEIDVDMLDNLGYELKGFNTKSFDGFVILKCCSVSNGEVVKDFLAEVQV